MGKALPRRVVPETYTQLLYEYLEAHGHAPEVVLGAPWPTPDTQGASGVDAVLWEQMLEAAEQYLEDPLIGLNLGKTIHVRHLGIIGAVLLACENLDSALQRLERYQRLIFDTVPMSRRIEAGQLELMWDISQYRTGRLVDETGFAVLVQFCRSLVRGTANPLVVGFTHQPPTDVRPYEDFFGCPVRFDQPKPMIRFALGLLSAPLKSPDPLLMHVLEQHAERLLVELPQQDDVVEQVRKAVALLLPKGEPSIETVGSGLSCSSRTLQRRLQAAGTNFRDELNLVRQHLAESYLRDPRLQVVDVALLLGYSEHSAFTRAFREWTGKTPRQARDESRGSRELIPRAGI